MNFVVPINAHAAACPNRLSILVPPSAVIHQPDGDTFHLFTFGVPNVVEIRVQGVDTPEKPTKTLLSPHFQEAKQFTADWLAKGPFRITTCGARTLTRVVAVVERDGRTLADDLIAAGHGVSAVRR